MKDKMFRIFCINISELPDRINVIMEGTSFTKFDVIHLDTSDGIECLIKLYS